MDDRPVSLRITRPCPAELASMPETESGWYCPRCEKPVHDLRRMTRREAEAFVRARGPGLCVRMKKGESGEAAFRPEPALPAVRAVRGAAIALALAACGGGETTSVEVRPEPVVAPVQPPPVEAAPPAEPVAEPTPVEATAVPAAEEAAQEAPAEASEPGATTPPEPPAPEDGTDSSAEHSDHGRHRHRHAPVRTQHSDDLLGGLDGL